MENEVIKSGLKNSIIVVITQSVSLVLGILKILILPIMLGTTNFGYWQVYLLYISYVGVFTLGFNDGIYLRYGKYNYQDLPKKVFRSSIRVFISIQICIMLIVSLLILLEPDIEKQKALLWASINIPITGLSGVLIYILQVTNQIKKYSIYTILDKIIVLLIIILLFIFKTDQYILVVIVDTFSKVIVLAIMCYSCKDILYGKGINIKTAYKELFENISVGIKLMLANLAGMLVLGFGRFIIERFENVEVYGTYSFALSTINLLLVFISAVGLVIYPTLNRLEEKRYSKYFVELNNIMVIIVFGLLIFYFPLYVFISRVMNEYVQIFEYLPIIFAIIFIQSKMQILINPYYKLLRQEKAMLRANIVGVIIAILIIVPSYLINKSVLMVAIGTFLAMGIRLYLSEIYLKKILSINYKSNIIVEIFGIIIFIFFAYQSNLLIGFFGYLIVFCICLIRNIKTVNQFIRYLF
ncbi:lipopolysaccharide biosynthesis protein [Metabacillus sediminilitoris]|nr:oligosaccharide flippase family protein [Metabacillus sediminilitoris]